FGTDHDSLTCYSTRFLVGAAEGGDLLILFIKAKDRSLRQLLQGRNRATFMSEPMQSYLLVAFGR
ncbi:hypothetical protein, partial [Pseudomonas sp.]|uniref:hypothetical protein n=1 Tax=Pseudomonas sp. TaxID=306 RepID=UPI0033424AF7